MIDRGTLANGALAIVALAVAVWATLGADAGDRWLVVLLALPLAGLLLVSMRWPVPAVGASLAALFLSDGAGTEVESAFLLALVTSCFVAGRYGTLSHLPWVGAGILWLLSGSLWSPGSTPSAGDAVFPVLFTAGPCLLGVAIQVASQRERTADDRARLLEAMRDEEVRRASAEERLRIARDLHDIVAHEISAISLQAQVARRDAEAGRTVDPASLVQMELTAQKAMRDARRLLGLLHRDGEHDPTPSPGHREIGELIEQARRLGQRIELTEEGERPTLPPAQSQAVYRIIQESLTNARRHAPSTPTTVAIRWDQHQLQVRVTNPAGHAGPVQPGHGLAGIEHRAQMFGGTASIGASEGAWVVAVRMPVPEEIHA